MPFLRDAANLSLIRSPITSRRARAWVTTFSPATLAVSRMGNLSNSTGGLVRAAITEPHALVTYTVAAQWDLPTILKVCKSAGIAADSG